MIRQRCVLIATLLLDYAANTGPAKPNIILIYTDD
ncbi:MAG: hypothetical protein ACI8XO_004710 [Verrucomicrobiales bacterium]|jgi:hypothetical protein